MLLQCVGLVAASGRNAIGENHNDDPVKFVDTLLLLGTFMYDAQNLNDLITTIFPTRWAFIFW